MDWERCGNTPFYRKFSSVTIYINPVNWSRVTVGADNGIAVVRYIKTSFDWEDFKESVRKFIPEEIQEFVRRATLEWFQDYSRQKNNPGALISLFKNAHPQARKYVLEGINALMNSRGSEIEPVTVVAVEKNSRAYGDLEDLKKLFDYAKKFYVDESFTKAVDDALGHFGIYEC